MKNISKLLLYNLLLIIFFVSYSTRIYAHEITLDVEYDDCLPQDYVSSSDIGDGYNEKWYELVKNNVARHISHSEASVTEIRYYISPVGETSTTITWSSGISNELSNRIIDEFIESMKKWNNVEYYVLNSEGLYERRKIVNIVEGTENNHNLIIYPCISGGVASTWPISSSIPALSVNSISHVHFTEWAMSVNISEMARMTAAELDNILSRTGAHEIGHVLGLRDIDGVENSNNSYYHHEEILMGYSKYSYYITRQSDITYKDIAGVAITRGFHTDSDHLWLYDEDNPKNGKYKLICSLCNCVKYVDDLSLYNYYEYEQCGHSESNLPCLVDDNMIPVASYGNTDYYKCKYCRYVAPFTSRNTQNYVYCGEHNNLKHILENNSNNLNYKISENHNLNIDLGDNNYKCSDCDYRIINTFEEYSLSNYSSTINKIVNLSGNETKYYKINSNYNKYYEFMVDGTNDIDLKLLNENFNEISVNDLNDSNNIEHIISQLPIGTYYLELKNNSTLTNLTSIKITSRNASYLSLGDSDILINTYNNITEYRFINGRGPGFYKFTIEAITSNGSIVTYPNETLKVYDHNNVYQEIKYDVNGYSENAENLSGTNYLYMYLERNGYYYIHINLPEALYASVKLTIENVVAEEVDVLSRYDEAFTKTLINSNSMTEFAKCFTINQISTFSLSAVTSGTHSGNITLVLFKEELNSDTNTYFKTDIIGDYLSTTIERLILEEGTYYIGFFGNTSNIPVTVTINRIVASEISNQVIVMDPRYDLPYGTEVRHNGGALGGTTITEGFTRHIHFQYLTGVPSISRYDYVFYSSNTSYATVSEFGTVFAKAVNTNKIVTIIAVNRNNPTIVYSINLTIVNDTSNTEKVIETTQTIKLSNFVNGKYKLILNESNSPYPWIKYYNWQVIASCQENDIVVTMDDYGYLTTSGIGSATLTGTYIINPNVTIIIHINFEK